MRLATRLLKAEKTTWAEVLNGKEMAGADRYMEGYADGYRRGLAEGHAKRPHPLTWRALAKNLLEDYEDDLTPWELKFVAGFLERGYPEPTPKQQAIFERICERCDLDMPG